MTEPKKRVLLVGLACAKSIPGVDITTAGLGRPDIIGNQAAAALYDYDVVVINPASYSHFIFGRPSKFSGSEEELWDLKKANNDHDLDTVFNVNDRRIELNVAMEDGTRIVWCLAPEKSIKFFGRRSVYRGFISQAIEEFVQTRGVHQKSARKVLIKNQDSPFSEYFKHFEKSPWRLCMGYAEEDSRVLAATPDNFILGIEVDLSPHKGWIVAPPSSDEGIGLLILAALGVKPNIVSGYHGIFLSHAFEDKDFVRKLKQLLEEQGVKNVWVDEAEMLIGDSLIKKIASEIEKTRYFGIVLSPASVQSNWVKKELELAMTKEIVSGDVVVLPLLHQECELPAFLKDKLYADFSSSPTFNESLAKLLRRLKS